MWDQEASKVMLLLLLMMMKKQKQKQKQKMMKCTVIFQASEALTASL